MATEALDTPQKNTWQVVKFNDAADGTLLAAFTDRDSDEVFEGVTYTSEPSMQVTLTERDGMLSSDTPSKINLPTSPINATAGQLAFLAQISSGQPYQEVEVNIVEISSSDSAPKSVLRTFRGELIFLEENAKESADVLTFEAVSDKQKLQPIKLGLPANHQCNNALGDRFCQVIISSFTHVLAITNIDGKVVTCSGVPDSLGDGFFRAGYLFVGSLRVRIHNWRDEVEGDKTKFFMQERVPTRWNGNSVTAVAGCDKSVETCRDKFDNEEHINPWGYAMPEYHPVYEDGGGRA